MTLQRPRTVTVATVLAWVQGEATIAVGALLLFLLARDNISVLQGLLFVLSFLTIGIGLVTVFVAGGLLSASRAARIAVTVLMGIAITVAVLAMLLGAYLDGVTATLAVIVICLLWLGRARPYFRSRRSSRLPS